MSDQAGDGVPRAVQAWHELLAWLIPYLDPFPWVSRFTLEERLRTALLSTIGHRAKGLTGDPVSAWRVISRKAVSPYYLE
jgi:hypothetical protein